MKSQEIFSLITNLLEAQAQADSGSKRLAAAHEELCAKLGISERQSPPEVMAIAKQKFVDAQIAEYQTNRPANEEPEYSYKPPAKLLAKNVKRRG